MNIAALLLVASVSLNHSVIPTPAPQPVSEVAVKNHTKTLVCSVRELVQGTGTVKICEWK